MLAYSLSKHFLIDEMEDADEHYEHLQRGEYYEFLVRLADVLYGECRTQPPNKYMDEDDEDGPEVRALCR